VFEKQHVVPLERRNQFFWERVCWISPYAPEHGLFFSNLVRTLASKEQKRFWQIKTMLFPRGAVWWFCLFFVFSFFDI